MREAAGPARAATSTSAGAASAARPSSRRPPAIRCCCASHRRSGDAAGAARWPRSTLDAMARGGIYDQLGGGFHRYSTDERWLVPHFEKMLYDNALLARVPTSRRTRPPGDAALSRASPASVLDYVLREMTRPRAASTRPPTPTARARRASSSSGRRRRCARRSGEERRRSFCAYYDITEAGQLRGAQHPQPAAAARRAWRPPGPGAAGAGSRLAARGPRSTRPARTARPARPRRQGADGLERPDDRRARGRGRRVLGEPRYLRRRRARGDLPARRAAAARRPAAPHLARRQGAPRRLPRGLRLPRRGLLNLYEAGGESDGSSRHGHLRSGSAPASSPKMAASIPPRTSMRRCCCGPARATMARPLQPTRWRRSP